MTTPSNALATQKPQGLKGLINSEAMRAQFALALPKHLTAERFTRVCLTALTRSPKLQECTPESFMRCLLDLSAMGLEPDGRRAHLIPYGKECTLVVDYKGIVELVIRSGMVSRIHADKVCENDVFEYDCGDVKKHAIDFKKPRGAAYAYYALVRFKDGTEKAEVMSLDDVIAIRNRSQGYKSAIQYNKSHPWITDFDEMAKKTVFRRCSKWLQLSPEIRDALEKDDDVIVTERVATGRVVSSDAPPVNHYAAMLDESDPKPEQSLEPVPESPVEVSEETERVALLSDIKETCLETEMTIARFGGLVKTHAFPNSTASLRDFPIADLRLVHDNRMAIAKGEYVGGDK